MRHWLNEYVQSCVIRRPGSVESRWMEVGVMPQSKVARSIMRSGSRLLRALIKKTWPCCIDWCALGQVLPRVFSMRRQTRVTESLWPDAHDFGAGGMPLTWSHHPLHGNQRDSGSCHFGIGRPGNFLRCRRRTAPRQSAAGTVAGVVAEVAVAA